ncbi:DUF2510 domain-containing protein [Nocardioides antri]|uniref:DUF2510 domain-containing protein n=1 Tax=Nocardioides antri TaxID=2607659 RepID=UPI00165F364A|nr:DUF2510 domain-containing protein [Nocardioides antri]
MPGPTPSQPGWYPDNNGTMRWYDGAAWTDHVQPGSAGPAEATVVSGAPPEPTRPLGQHEGPPGWQGGQPPSGPHSSPPPSPPSGQPVAPYGAVPQPSFPGGPGGPGGPGFQPSSGGGNKGLLIVLAVVGAIVLIAVLAVGAWAVFLRDDDSDGGGGDSGGGDDSSLPDTPPEEVVEAFFDAARDGDCEAALELVSQNFIEENDANCDDEEDFMEAGEFEAEVGEATIDEEADPPTASVPVNLTIEGFGEQEVPLGLVVEDEEWKIDSFEEEDGGTEGTEGTDGADSPSAPLSTPELSIPTDGIEIPSFPTDPSEIESYLSEFSEYLTVTP